jgi:hypothetical protein
MTTKTPDAEARIARFLAKYSPAIEAQLREARSRLRASFPRGFELVFDNYNALVFGISASESARDAFLSVAGYPKWVTLFFLHGASLRDPKGLLEGSGKQVRSIRLREPGGLDAPDVRALIAQAILPQASRLLAAPALATIIKMEVAKQRPRRPATPVGNVSATASRNAMKKRPSVKQVQKRK